MSVLFKFIQIVTFACSGIINSDQWRPVFVYVYVCVGVGRMDKGWDSP